MPELDQNTPESAMLIRPSGARRRTLTMLAMIDRADAFSGLPRGTAKPLQMLGAFQEAEPYLGLPPHAFKLVSWLVKQTQARDWEEGSRPIAWPSARFQAEFLGLSPARVKALNRALFEAGIFVMRDNEQGKRYGRRGPDGRIVEAFGFDLSPLAQRYDEFVQLAAAAKIERDRMKALRRRVTLARRAIRQTGEELMALEKLPAAWPRLEAEAADLVAAARGARYSEDLALLAASLERRKDEAEQWLRDTVVPVNTNPEGLVNEPHPITTTLKDSNLNTVIANEESSSGPRPQPQSPPSRPPLTAEREFRLKAPQLLDLAPKLGRYVTTETPSWTDIVEAAGGWLRTELGVSPSLWGTACQVLGREGAAVALAIVSTKDQTHFTRGAGGYFAGMVKKAQQGELHLDRTLWKLREEKWGKGREGGRWMN